MSAVDLNLTDKVAIVTGASRGIGRAIALTLAHQGASVAIDYLSEGDPDEVVRAQEVVRLIRQRGSRAIAVEANVSQRQAVNLLVSKTVDAFGQVNILVNNAGIPLHRLMVDTTDEEWDRVFNVNLCGCFLCSQLVAREMVRQGTGGRIINISSQVATRPIPTRAAYSASKAAIEAFTRVCALELGPHHITVNAVAPGATRTTMISQFDNPAWIESVVSHIPLGKLGQPEDIAACVLFLASNAASHITGQVIHVDGGHTAGEFTTYEQESN